VPAIERQPVERATVQTAPVSSETRSEAKPEDRTKPVIPEKERRVDQSKRVSSPATAKREVKPDGRPVETSVSTSEQTPAPEKNHGEVKGKVGASVTQQKPMPPQANRGAEHLAKGKSENKKGATKTVDKGHKKKTEDEHAEKELQEKQ
jgi:hypothetical protein